MAAPRESEEDETVSARAKAEAAAAGMSDHVEASFAGIAAAREADATDVDGPSDVDGQRALDLTDDLQRLIGRERRRTRRVDGTTYEMEVTTATLPTHPARNLARRFARQSALLRRYGRHTEAVAAAAEAVARYAARTDLDDTEQGYHAYSLVLLAEDLLARRGLERAHDPAATAMRLFIAYRPRLVPGGIPDIVRAGLVLAQCQAHRGGTGAARQTLLDIAHLADELDATFRGPVGVPGSMPGGWGLPVVPSARDWKVLRKRLVKLSKQVWG